MITGKMPPPYMGPSVAFQILIHSRLREIYRLIPFNVQVNQTLDTLGKWSVGKISANFKLYAEFNRSLKTEKPDLVLIPISQSTTGFIKDSVFILLCSANRVKTVLQLRGSNFRNWFTGSSFWVKWYVRFILKKTEGVIVLGEKLKYLFSGLVPDHQIYVVPNGANILLPEKKAESSGLPEILYLANLQGSKGIEDVMEAIHILHEKHPGTFRMKVAGAWREDKVKEFCLSLAEKAGLPVEFIGPVSGDEKFRILSEADIFVFTPREPEGHPWVVVEAMAASLPVIATDKGAISESIVNEINGYIVEDRAPEQIAGKLLQLITNTELHRQMGKRNRVDYESKYTEDRMVLNFQKVFDRILGD